jgi:Holliday junction resolvasome RuvABC endonuclease subunit
MELTYEALERDRLLAVDPVAKGFGFVVLEVGPLRLVDWGVRHCGRRAPEARARAIARLLQRYEPTTLILEDAREVGSLRAIALEDFVADIGETLLASPVSVHTYTRSEIRRAFRRAGAVTKEQIAHTLVAKFPELSPHEPRRRQIWEGEDSRMTVFDALSLVAAHLDSGDG